MVWFLKDNFLLSTLIFSIFPSFFHYWMQKHFGSPETHVCSETGCSIWLKMDWSLIEGGLNIDTVSKLLYQNDHTKKKKNLWSFNVTTRKFKECQCNLTFETNTKYQILFCKLQSIRLDERNIDSTKKETNIGIFLHSTSNFCLKVLIFISLKVVEHIPQEE